MLVCWRSEALGLIIYFSLMGLINMDWENKNVILLSKLLIYVFAHTPFPVYLERNFLVAFINEVLKMTF